MTPAAINQDSIIERIREWPTQPGIYIMRDGANRILYVGKAKNLRNRIKSYFQNPKDMTGKTRMLVKRIANVEFTVTNTELEALLLECNLIKKHRPRYNIRLKDDKNFPYVVLDFTHPFPQLRITRKVVISPNLRYFGPFSGGVKEISRFLQKTFQIRDCSDAKFKGRTRPCLNYEIGTCTAPCVGIVDQNGYSKQLREAILFLKGKKSILVKDLRKEMMDASDKLEFETARVLRDKIHAIERLTQRQDAVLLDHQQDIDVVGVHVSGNEMQWVVLFVRSGNLTGRRAEKIQVPLEMEEAARGFLEQFYTISLIPDEVWVTDDFIGREVLEEFLSQRAGKPVLVQVKRGEKPLRLLGMAHENAKLIYEEGQRKTGSSGAGELQEVLGLPEPPQTIEGIDVSNFQGQSPAVALVHFSDERPLKSRYRIYYPRTVEGQNDFAMIYETVQRRFSDLEKNPPPDLLLIDGGKGQLSSALKALEELKVEIPVVSLAKARTKSAFTRKEVQRSEERIFVPNRKNPIVLKEGHPALRLLQQVRDEAHRFSVKSHRTRRTKWALEGSPITGVEGVGEKTKDLLLKHFGTMERISEASVEELIQAGVARSRAEALHTELSSPVAEEIKKIEEE